MASTDEFWEEVSNDPAYQGADRATQAKITQEFITRFGSPSQLSRAPSTARGVLSATLGGLQEFGTSPIRLGAFIGEKTGLISPETAGGVRESLTQASESIRGIPLKPGSPGWDPSDPRFVPPERPTAGQELAGGVLSSMLPVGASAKAVTGLAKAASKIPAVGRAVGAIGGAAEKVAEASPLIGGTALVAGKGLVKLSRDAAIGGGYAVLSDEDPVNTSAEFAAIGGGLRVAGAVVKVPVAILAMRKIEKAMDAVGKEGIATAMANVENIARSPFTSDLIESGVVDKSVTRAGLPLLGEIWKSVETTLKQAGKAGEEMLNRGLFIRDFALRTGRGSWVESGLRGKTKRLSPQDDAALIDHFELGKPLPPHLQETGAMLKQSEALIDKLNKENGTYTIRKVLNEAGEVVEEAVPYQSLPGHLPRRTETRKIEKWLAQDAKGKAKNAEKVWTKWAAKSPEFAQRMKNPDAVTKSWRNIVEADSNPTMSVFHQSRIFPNLGAEFWKDFGFSTRLKDVYPAYLNSSFRRIAELKALGGAADAEVAALIQARNAGIEEAKTLLRVFQTAGKEIPPDIVNAALRGEAQALIKLGVKEETAAATAAAGKALVARARLPERERLINGMTESGVSGKLANTSTDLLLGRSDAGRMDNKFLSTYSSITSLYLGRTAIINVPEIMKTINRFGVRDFMEGLKRIAKGADQEAIMDATRVFDLTAKDLMMDNFGKFSQWYLKATGFTATDVIVRAMANASAKVHLERVLHRYAKNPNDKTVLAMLREARISPQAAGRGLSELERWQGVQRLVEEVMPVGEARKLPPFWREGPWGKLLFQFQGWGFQHTKHLKEMLKSPLKRRKLQVATEMLTFGVPSATAFELRRQMAGKEPAEDFGELMINPVSISSMFGMAGAIWVTLASDEFTAQRGLTSPASENVKNFGYAGWRWATALFGQDDFKDAQTDSVKALQKSPLSGLPTELVGAPPARRIIGELKPKKGLGKL